MIYKRVTIPGYEYRMDYEEHNGLLFFQGGTLIPVEGYGSVKINPNSIIELARKLEEIKSSS